MFHLAKYWLCIQQPSKCQNTFVTSTSQIFFFFESLQSRPARIVKTQIFKENWLKQRFFFCNSLKQRFIIRFWYYKQNHSGLLSGETEAYHLFRSYHIKWEDRETRLKRSKLVVSDLQTETRWFPICREFERILGYG